MVSWFDGSGDETPADKRNYGFAFAALKSSMYLALMAAKRGHLMPDQAREHSQMVRDGLSIVPEAWLPQEGRNAIEEALKMIEHEADSFIRSGN